MKKIIAIPLLMSAMGMVFSSCDDEKDEIEMDYQLPSNVVPTNALAGDYYVSSIREKYNDGCSGKRSGFTEHSADIEKREEFFGPVRISKDLVCPNQMSVLFLGRKEGEEIILGRADINVDFELVRFNERLTIYYEEYPFIFNEEEHKNSTFFVRMEDENTIHFVEQKVGNYCVERYYELTRKGMIPKWELEEEARRNY